ncbi:LOW QUALITY PROTEIN: hypothetical protein V1477_010925 [Vespula maculifrons]|uniref:Uncharacterized protein n=1 Tax=Vespula maculifrons TaxID=7453 RepID=A0ABD2C3C0_VESMC
MLNNYFLINIFNTHISYWSVIHLREIINIYSVTQKDVIAIRTKVTECICHECRVCVTSRTAVTKSDS